MKYKIWNGTDTIYTPDGTQHTPEEWKNQFGWLNIPGIKCIIADAPLNGAVCMEFEQTKTVYKSSGAKITDDMTDQQVLDAISEFEENPPITVASAEERIAAALEAQVMMAEDDVVVDETTIQPKAATFAMRSVTADASGTGLSEDTADVTSVEIEDTPSYIRARNNYQRGLWSDNLVKVAVRKGHITTSDYQRITGKAYTA